MTRKSACRDASLIRDRIHWLRIHLLESIWIGMTAFIVEVKGARQKHPTKGDGREQNG